MKKTVIFEYGQLNQLLDILRKRGYRNIGPVIQNNAIIYDDLNSPDDLPRGWTEEQSGGSYRLVKRSDNALFGYNVGPHAWKKFLHPPKRRLWKARRTDDSFHIIEEKEEQQKYAFFGVRPCDLHAISVQDKVYISNTFINPTYKIIRENAFVIAVNCGQAGGTCFCASMNTGPRATAGFDMAITEVLEEGHHYFILESGAESASEILLEIPCREAKKEELQKVEHITKNTAKQMGKSMDAENIKELLYNNYEHPRWDDVARRCLTCANCTMVCPTCFCTSVEDITDLTGEHAERWQRWDSCFTMDFSYIHGGSIRPSTKSRYRQWMTHKLATWIDQFGVSGCVGCGRCITWCPVAIDITEEVHAIRENQANEKDAQ